MARDAGAVEGSLREALRVFDAQRKAGTVVSIELADEMWRWRDGAVKVLYGIEPSYVTRRLSAEALEGTGDCGSD